MNSIGKNIKSLRVRRGMTQDALAEQLCVTRQTVSNYETGKSQPDIQSLMKLADIFQVDIQELLCEPEDRSLRQKKFVKVALHFLLVAVLGLALSRTIQWAATINQGHTQWLNILLRLLLQPVYYFLLGWIVTASIRSLYTTVRIPSAVSRWILIVVSVLSTLLLLALFPYYSIMFSALGIPYIRVPVFWMNITHWITRGGEFIWICLLLGAILGTCGTTKAKAS